MRDRRPERREDAVAGGLHDVAVVAVGRVDHQLEGGVNDRACFLWVEVLFQFGRAFDVGDRAVTVLRSPSRFSDAGVSATSLRRLGALPVEVMVMVRAWRLAGRRSLLLRLTNNLDSNWHFGWRCGSASLNLKPERAACDSLQRG
jgi:hypothetical protein